MGTQGTGRKRIPNRERLSGEDDALNQIAREAEARLAAKRAARAEAREIRMKELERQQKEVEERPERDFVEKGSRSTSTLSAATLASLGGTSSRRGSGDTSISVDTEASIREIKDIHELKDQIQDVESKYMKGLKEVKDSLAEVEEKYRKAMVSNAQLDNEKTNLLFQVDTLKDSLIELEEQLAETRREYEEKSKQYEREKHAHSVLQFQFSEMKKTLQQTEELLAKHGIVPGLEVTANGEAGSIIIDGPAESETVTMEIQDSAQGSQSQDGVIEIRLRKLMDERENLIEQIRKLKLQLEDKQRVGNMENTSPEPVVIENGTDTHVVDLQRDTNRQISDLKFKLVKSEQEVTALEQNVIRLEGQVTRYKCAAENSEKIEDELKAEKRKLQRELRTALDKIDELEVGNSHLVKRLEKMKANRSALLSQQ
uniref:LRR binding FLII interacting protein 1 n=1 Tax=Erpetoichthys calabaricus TaxID=27687 RepID=A0A8C4T4Y8_ERPCA